MTLSRNEVGVENLMMWTPSCSIDWSSMWAYCGLGRSAGTEAGQCTGFACAGVGHVGVALVVTGAGLAAAVPPDEPPHPVRTTDSRAAPAPAAASAARDGSIREI